MNILQKSHVRLTKQNITLLFVSLVRRIFIFRLRSVSAQARISVQRTILVHTISGTEMFAKVPHVEGTWYIFATYLNKWSLLERVTKRGKRRRNSCVHCHQCHRQCIHIHSTSPSNHTRQRSRIQISQLTCPVQVKARQQYKQQRTSITQVM